MRYLEDHHVGLVTTSGKATVTKEEIIEFAQRWDPQPFHVDEEAARNSIYGGITACTAHLFALACRLDAEMEMKVAGLAGLGFDEMRVHQPLRPGDTVYATSECTGVRRSQSKPDRGIVQCHTKLFNQRHELIFSLRCDMMVASRPHDV